jgi:RHS repeat-associated protein
VHTIPTQHSTGTPFKASEVTWPSAGTGTAALASPAVKPHAAGTKAAAGSTPAWTQAVADAKGAYAGPSSVQVKVLPHQQSATLGVSGVVLTASGTSAAPGQVKVGLDYHAFAQQNGGNFGSRLKLVELPACALTTPSVAACRVQTPIGSINDPRAESVAAQVSLGGSTQVAASSRISGANTTKSAAITSSTVVLAATADPGTEGGAGGSYAATSLKPSGSWNEGGDSGSYDYTYPVTLPGSSSSLTPTVALSYSSQSVDGQTPTTNAQSSWAGDGWNTPDSFIEQSFATCADSPEGTSLPSSEATQDECYSGPVLTVSLNGASTSLVCTADETSCTEQSDTGDVVTHVTNSGNGSGTYNTDYWKITQRNGTSYYFGLNELPGYSSAGSNAKKTNSVDSEPVYSANSGDPCYNATFTSAVCTMAYRWHLDYVTNTTGQAMAYYYAQTSNEYGQDNGATDVSYIRDSYLSEIDYGFADGGAYGTVPDEVKFTPSSTGRCVQSSCTALTDPSMTSTLAGTDDPDVPFDLLCGAPYAETTCTSYAPSFFSTTALASIETYQYSTAKSAYVPVDLYGLTQTEPATGDTTNSTLWLSGIQHTGEDTTAGASSSGISMPSVSFQGTDLENRVDTKNFPGLFRYRLTQITSELGAVTTISYTAPTACTAAYVEAETASSAETNTESCFPVYWQPAGYSAPTLDWFNSYAVHQVLVEDATGGSLTQETDYTYGGGAAYRYDDNEVTKAKYRTYGQFRGYKTVTTYTGQSANNPQTESIDTYYRGMDGNWSIATGATKSATVPDSLNGVHTDSNALAGDVLESRSYLGSGGPLQSDTITSYWVSGAVQTRTRTSLPNLTAQMTGTAEVYKSQVDTDGGETGVSTVTEADTTYDATTSDATFGLPLFAYSHTVPVNSAYDQCTRTKYAPANTTENLVGRASYQEIDQAACSGFTEGSPAQVPSGYNTLGAPSSVTAAQVASATQTFYDDTSFSTTYPQATAPSKGLVTMVRKAKSGTSGSFTYQTVKRDTYDLYGRVVDAYDGIGNESVTSYTVDSAGLTTGATVTAPSTSYTNPSTGVVTTIAHVKSQTLDPTRNLALTSTDENGIVTTETYDALGRLVNVWEHGRATSLSPNLEYAYTVSNTKPSGVTTQTLDDAGAYNTSVTVDDSLGRARQTQTPTPQGGRLITDTLYDSRGWVLKKNNPYWDSTTTPAIPTGALPGAADNAVPNQDDYVYDGLGRVVQDLSENDAVVKSTTTTVYNGDATTVIPGINPSGKVTGTVKTTKTNPLGQTSALVEYTTNPTLTTPSNTFTGTWYITAGTGTTITTSYTYDAAGNQVSTTDQAGDVWKAAYDLFGEKTSSTDPDAGTNTMLYDGDGNLQQTIDALGHDISYTYDALGRKTAEFAAASSAECAYGSTTCTSNETASWIYDNANGVSGVTHAIGQATTKTSYSGGYPYVEQSLGYNNFGESLGSEVIIPSVQGTTLGKTWKFTNTYTTTTGLLFSSTFPVGGGLPAETTTPSYTAGLYLPNGLGSTLAGYDDGTTYTAYSQVEATILGNGTNDATITDQYDPHTGQLTDQSVTRNKTTPAAVDDTSYTYNAAGLTTAETDTRFGATSTAETQCFTYTPQSQLAQAWTSNVAAPNQCATVPTSSSHTTVGDPLSAASAYDETFAYNTSAGEQASEVSYNPNTAKTTTTTDTYNGNSTSQPTTLTSTATSGGSTGSTSYKYNSDGQQTTRTTALGSQALTWNNDGTLSQVTNSTKSTTSNYIYDASGNLLLQEDPGTTTLYLPGQQIAYNTSAATATGVRYYSLPGGAIVARTGQATTAYDFEITSDQHGTNTLYLDYTCQTPTWRQQDPFGNSRGTTQAWIDNRGFLNKVNDTTTGLTDVGARWYDQSTGSFVSLDPVLEANDPTQLAGYDYAGNDPVSNSDPTGQTICDVVDCHNGWKPGGGSGGGSGGSTGGTTGSTGGTTGSSGGSGVTVGAGGTTTVTTDGGSTATYHSLSYIIADGKACTTQVCQAYASADFYAYSEAAAQCTDPYCSISVMAQASSPLTMNGLTQDQLRDMGIQLPKQSLSQKASGFVKKLLDPFSLFDAAPDPTSLASKTGPDYVALEVSVISPYGVGLVGGATVTRDGHLYVSGGITMGTPGPGAAARDGFIGASGDRTKLHDPGDIDSFVSSWSIGASGTAPGFSAGETLGQVDAPLDANSWATEYGFGLGAGVGVGLTYSWRMGFNVPDTW